MKKLLAIVLALMLMMASAALAETASVAILSNPTLVISSPEGDMNLDLSGLEATVAAGLSGETPTVQLDVAHDAEELLGLVLQIVDNKVVVALDGMSRPIASAIPETGTDTQETMVELFSNLQALSELKMPAFGGVTVPKLDLMPVAGLLGSEPTADANGVQSASFSLPYEQVNQMLGMLEYIIPAETQAQPQVSQLLQLIKMLQNSKSGFALEGKVSDSGDKAELLVDILPVQNGVTASEAAVTLYLVSLENSDSFEVQVNQGGQKITVATIDLASDPAAATLDFAMDVMGELKLNFSLYPQNGAQVAALAVVAQGETFNASVTYGEEGETEYVDFAMEIPAENVAFSVHSDSTPADGGDKTGTLAVAVDADGQTINFAADVLQTQAEVEFRDIANIENAYDANNMTEADNQALSAEMEGILGNLMNYLSTVQMQPAA